MNWPWSTPKKKWVGPMRGVRESDVRVDAPPVDASDEQWLDFAAVSAMFCCYWMGEREWRGRALRAYLAKWPKP